MITIITSLYNSNTHLNKYIKNIEKFSLYLTKYNVNHEFIIIPNSPNKKERDKLKEIRNNKIIKPKIIICERESLYATWNRGCTHARYPNVTFWNVDDVRFPEAIISGLNKINEGNDIVYFPFIYKRYIKLFNIKILAKIKKFKMIEFDKVIFSNAMHIGPFFIANKKSLEGINLFDDSFKISGDLDLQVRAVKKGLVFKKDSTIAGIFTNDGTTLSGSKNKLHKEENMRILM
jgi:hypothetical protein